MRSSESARFGRVGTRHASSMKPCKAGLTHGESEWSFGFHIPEGDLLAKMKRARLALIACHVAFLERDHRAASNIGAVAQLVNFVVLNKLRL